MTKRIFDLFLGLSIGNYLEPTITLLGFTLPWTLIGLGISTIIVISKWIGKILWKKLIDAIKNDING